MTDNEDSDQGILEKTPVRRKRRSEDPFGSLDKLDRSPPDLWPDKNKSTINTTPMNSSPPPSWTKGLSQDDLNTMHQLGCLSVNGISTELRKIYDKAYQMGVIEKREMSRGRQLGIFTNTKKKQSN